MEAQRKTRNLEKQLKEIQIEHDVLQRDFQQYVKENKTLKEQLETFRDSHSQSDEKAVQMFNNIKTKHQQLANLREEEHQKELRELKLKVNIFKQGNKEAKVEIQNLRSANSQLKSENKSLLSQHKDSKSEESKSNVRLRSLEDKLTTLERENTDKDTVIKSITNKVNEYELKLKSSNHQGRKMEELEMKLKRLQAECDKKEKELANMTSEKTEWKSSSSKMNIRIRSLEDQLGTLKQELKDREEYIEQKSNELHSNENELRSASSQHKLKTKLLEEKIQKLQIEKQNQEHELEEIRSSNKGDKAVVAKQCVRVKVLEDQLSDVRGRCKEKEDLIAKMTSEKTEWKSSSSKMNIRIRSLEDQLGTLNQELKDREEYIEQKSNELHSNENELRSASSQHKLKTKLLEEKIQKLQIEKQNKEHEVEEIRYKHSEVETLASRSDMRIRTLEQHVTRLKREIKDKDETIAKTNAEASSHVYEAKSASSQQKTKLKTLEEQVKRFQHELGVKEDEICQMSTKLAHAELESSSNASNYRVRIATMEEKLERLSNDIASKDDELLQSNSELSEMQGQAQSLRDKIRRMEMDNKLKENQLKEVRSMEHEMSAKSLETSSRIQSIQHEKTKLGATNTRLQSELADATRKLSSLECDVAEARFALKQKERQLEKLKGSESVLKATKDSETASLQQELINLQTSVVKLKADNQTANRAKREQTSTIEQLEEQLKEEGRRCRTMEEQLALASQNHHHSSDQQKIQLDGQERKIAELNMKLSQSQREMSACKQNLSNLENKYEVVESQYEDLKVSLKEHQQKYGNAQASISDLKRQKESLGKECRNLTNKLQSLDVNHNVQSSKVGELEKTISMLKESCVMLEKQAEDLEVFNNQLIEKQNLISVERDTALGKCSELELRKCELEHKLRNELHEMDQTNTDHLTELQIQLRNEMNKAHETTEEYRDLERRYKMLELNAAAVQRKLNSEKEQQLRLKDESCRSKVESASFQKELSRLKHELSTEMDRCDLLEKEKTTLQNELDSFKLEHSHELVKLNCTGAQQIKLIDFLQSKIEELEPAEKKKKKIKKTTLYQAPLQYRELRDLLEEEKAANVRLQEQVNNYRSELQVTNSKVKRLKHGMNSPAPLSPSSIAAISAIVKSPAATPTTADQSQPSKGSKLRSKPRMHHNIPHRLTSWVCTRATRCSVCLSTLHFGHGCTMCQECGLVVHNKCQTNVTNTCGLPGGLFQQFKDGAKTSNLSPITCVFKGSNSDQLHGKLKVLCGDETWTPRFVRLCGGQIRIAHPSAKSPSKHSDKDDIIDLKQAAYIHTDVSNLELPTTAKQDVPYVFKIQTGSSNSCWPARSIFLMSGGYAEKHHWVGQLEAVTSQHNGEKNITSNAKIFGNEILTLLSDERLEMNCSLPISDKRILLGCDEGLFIFTPNKSVVSSRSNLKQIDGVSKIFKMSNLDSHKVIAIEGGTQRLVVFDIKDIHIHKVTPRPIEDIHGCHIFAVGYAEGVHYICAASATNITLLRFNEKLKKFCVKKEIGTSEPCTCMVFTACSVIVGTNKFHEIDLSDFRIDEFLDDPESIPSDDGSIFPVEVLRLNEDGGTEEFLLCYHEFGLFVDGFGRLTRSGQIYWSRMPLAFEYRAPYLAVVQFNSVEIIQIDKFGTNALKSALDHAFLSFPSARFLGQAITDGALYLSSCEGTRTSIFCCKGNMDKETNEKSTGGPLANKRRYAALSSSMDSLPSSPSVKRSSVMSDVSNLLPSHLSSSQSILDTSRWTTTTRGSYDEDDESGKGFGIIRNKMSSSEDSIFSDTTVTSADSRLQWNKPRTDGPPAKPSRKRRNNAQIPSTEV